MDTLEFTITRYWHRDGWKNAQAERITFRHAPGDERATALNRETLHVAKACHVTPNAWIVVGVFNQRPHASRLISHEEYLELGGVD